MAELKQQPKRLIFRESDLDTCECVATTKKGKPCPIPADRMRDGIPYCHVHDPEGTFRKQMRARRGR